MKIKDWIGVIKGCFSGARNLLILVDEVSGNFVVVDRIPVYQSKSLACCWDYIAGKYYKYGYDFTVQGYPGDIWVEKLFRSKRLRREDYLCFQEV